jgi:glycosyltransferase involved in cell wall biosynthesis
MEDQWKVSVIIPCYNHGQYLEEALESLERSTYPHLEVIVIDDGSTEKETMDHLERLRGYKVKGQPVKFVRQANQGLSATRNNGIRMSTGAFILPLDADDRIDETFIEKCVWVLTKYSHVSIVYPSVQHFGSRNDRWYPRPYDFQALLHDNFMIATSMFRKQVWEDVQGYDESLPAYEDWDFWIRAGDKGHQGYWLREPLFFYRKKEESMLVEANKRRKQLVKTLRRKNKDIFKRHLGSQGRNAGAGGSKFRKWLGQRKWQLFVLYTKVASKVPTAVKDRLRNLIKPLVRKIFGYQETYLSQDQTLAQTAVDEHLERGYQYRPNLAYREAIGTLYHGKPKALDKPSILFLVPWLNVGGADKVNLDLISQFVERGHEVHLFTTLSHEHPWHHLFKECIPGVTHLGNWFHDLNELLDYVIDTIHAHRIDVIQLSNSQLGYQMLETIKKYCPQVKIVDLLHMEEPYYPFDYFRYSVRFKENIDHRVVITPYLKEAMVRKYGEVADRVTVIPNGFLVPEQYEGTNYPAKHQREPFVIGFIGRMEEQKQPLDVVRTAHRVLQLHPNVKFMLVGDGSLLQPAKDLAKSLGIEHQVEFLGNRENGAAIMKEHFHVFLAPSLREGLPIVGLEALSQGVPIVATSVPGWFELVTDGETGFLRDVHDIEGFAQACSRLLQEPETRLSISRTAYRRAKDSYSLQSTATQYLRLYQQLLSGDQKW